ncbi:hypothetical protein AAKU55_003889 [Oxalobacteraceae bacterium GrIS 1.11]
MHPVRAESVLSRRFGRNQKRRLREQLGDALHAVDQEKVLSAAMGGRMSRLQRGMADAESFARDIARMVGPYAMAAGAPARLDFRVGGDFPLMSPRRFLSAVAPVNVAPLGLVRAETMRLLRIEAVRRGMTRAMHCTVRLANSSYCYAISDGALENMGDHLVGMLAQHIAAGLVRELVKGRAAR